jgi:hypothetical protein
MHIRIGKGEVVSQLGYTESNVPCVIIESVRDDEIGKTGQPGPERLNSGTVENSGIVLEIHSVEGAMVLIEDISKAAMRIGVPQDANPQT